MKYYKYMLIMLMLFFSVNMSGQYNPENPIEPGVYYTMTLQSSPEGVGSYNINSVTSYSEGVNVRLRAYTASNFTFVAWEENGEILSKQSDFVYTMPAKNVTLVAHYKYNPSNPSEPDMIVLPKYSRLNLKCNPSDGGYLNVNNNNRYEVGSSVNLSAYAHSDFVFEKWTENGEIVSTSSRFNYIVKEGNPELIAHFKYNPGNPDEPSVPLMHRHLYVESDPENGGYFNINSGNEYQEGSSVYLRAYSNRYYQFKNWTLDGEVISSKYDFYFTMPSKNVKLVAHYDYNYNPENPVEPVEPEGNVSIYGMTENVVRGQQTLYPVYFENKENAVGIAFDVQFPKDFVVNTSDVILSGRISSHQLTVTDLGDNNYRFSLLGTDFLLGNNGKLLEIPVTVPKTANMGESYPVKLTHGVLVYEDKSEKAISVRSGNLLVEKISEDGLYARFSYDKLNNRVKFTNMSSSKSLRYEWDFGDGTTSNELEPLHIYNAAGTYNVKLTSFGEFDKDVAELTVLVNEEGAWKTEGMFFLSDKVLGVRYFTHMDDLLQFIGKSTISGNIRISVQADQSFSTSVMNNNIQIWNKIFSSLTLTGAKLIFNKWKSGRNPDILLGNTNETFNRDFVNLFTNNGDRLVCDGVNLKFWGISYQPHHIQNLKNQRTHSGEKTQEWDFSTISSDLHYSWSTSVLPDGVSGALLNGNGNLPSMTIQNEGDGVYNIVYHIIGDYKGTTFCEFTKEIAVSPALVGLFNKLTPTNGTISESTTVTLTWNSIKNAIYDVYLWNATNAFPKQPVVEGISDLHFVSKNFCQNGSSYKWLVIARNESQQLASDTMHFSVRSLPDLHVYALNCSEAMAGKQFSVEWDVKNDGLGSTGNIQWNDYVWLVTDVYGGTRPSGTSDNKAKLLATVKNVKSLDVGESYHNKVDITLDERVYGNHYIIVASDMYSVTDIEWSSIGGSVINPYTPTQDGSGYKHLYARTSSSYNQLYERGETETYSDNFFYKAINIAIPPLVDLQIPEVKSYVIPDEEPVLAIGANKKETPGLMPGWAPPVKYITWEECYVPSPITAAGLRKVEAYYSGKKIAIEVTVANKGGKSADKSFKVAVYMSSSKDREAAPLIPLGAVDCPKHIKAKEDTTLTFAFYMPYEWHGDTYFHAYADIDDNVYELVNTANNWGQSDKVDIMLCPGADFVPDKIVAPKSISATSKFDVSYHVSNRGAGVPFTKRWTDEIYLSKKKTSLDESAKLLTKSERKGKFECSVLAMAGSAPSGARVIVDPEKFVYKGDDYDGSFSLSPSGLSSGDYYVYVKVDAENRVYEHAGEENNVICFGPIKYVQPDLSAELVSVSEDTLSTGQEIAFTWKVKNTGVGDLQNVKVTDAFYASVNQDGSNATLLGEVSNTMWIASGAEKELRATIKMPSIKGLDGLRYLFVRTNVNRSVNEESSSNNSSALLKSWCKYVADPVVVKPTVRGANLYVSNLSLVEYVKPGEQTTLNYIVRNNGELDIANKELTYDVYVSSNYEFSKSNAVKCKVVKQLGSVSKLRAGGAVSISQTVVIPSSVVGGRKYLYVLVDADNTLQERNTRDNSAYASFYMNGNLADLKVKEYALADTIYTSADASLKYTIQNVGEWNAQASNSAVYLSSDKVVDWKDKQLSSVNIQTLEQGKDVTCTVNCKVSDDLSGNWFVLVCIDPENRVLELNETNNVEAIPVTIVQSPLPDLLIKSVTTDEVLTAGQNINVHAVIENIGDHATRTAKWSDSYYLSSNTILNTDRAIHIGSKMHTGIVNVGETYTSNATFRLPPSIQGNYMLFAVSDASGSITERDENNNVKGIPVYINGSVDTPADLVISNIHVPTIIKAGSDLTFSYDIANEGEFTASGDINDVIYLSEDNRWDKEDIMVGIVQGRKTIHPGNKITRTVTGRITNMPEGDYYLIVKTNSTRSIAEQNEENNIAVVSSPCKLTFTTIHLEDNVTVNTSGYYKLEIPSGYDGKTVGFYLNHTEETAAGLYATYEKVPSTAEYDYASTSLLKTQSELLLPNVKAGKYYILAQDNRALVNGTGNVFSETDTGSSVSTTMSLNVKDVQFGATTLTIKEGGTGGWASTEINGALFDSIMDFRLQSGNKTIPIETLTFENMTRTRVTFNLNNASTGAYDIVSELPHGKQATLPNGYKVIPGATVNLSAKVDAPGIVRVGSYAPISVSYANGGNTDISVYKLMLVIDNGYLGTSIKDLDRHQSVLFLDLEAKSDSRGYTSIAPGVQRTLNLFMYQTASSSSITIYVVK